MVVKEYTKDWNKIEKSKPYLRIKPVKYLRKEGGKYIYKEKVEKPLTIEQIEKEAKSLARALEEADKLAGYYADQQDRFEDLSLTADDHIGGAMKREDDKAAKEWGKKMYHYGDLAGEAEKQWAYVDRIWDKINNKMETLSHKVIKRINQLNTKWSKKTITPVEEKELTKLEAINRKL